MEELIKKIMKDKKLVDKFRLLYDLSIELELEIYNRFGFDCDNYSKIREISYEIEMMEE